MGNVKVSVVTATYNQERFIRHTLESVVTQKTNFDFELIVGDDCSTDKTAEIVREYAEMYPNIIVPVIREKNLGMAGNITDLMMRSKGEYIAYIEGDDYWTEENKLQKQVDFLDSHPDYVACFSRFIVVDENEKRHPEHEHYGNYMSEEGEYTVKEFEQLIMPGQTATSMYRKAAYGKLQQKLQNAAIDTSKMRDISQILCMLSVGKMYVFGEYLSAYRFMLDPNSGSWSSKNDAYNIDNLLTYLNDLKDMEILAKALGLSISFDQRRKFEYDKLVKNKKQFSAKQFRLIRKQLVKDSNSKKDLLCFIIKKYFYKK